MRSPRSRAFLTLVRRSNTHELRGGYGRPGETAAFGSIAREPPRAARPSAPDVPEAIGSVAEAAVLPIDRYADGLAAAFPPGGVRFSPSARAAAAVALGVFAIGVVVRWASSATRDAPILSGR